MGRFAETFLNWSVMAQYAPKIAEGAWVTIQIALAVVAAGIASGLALAVLRAFRFRLANFLIVVAVDVLRALPPLVIIILFYFALPAVGVQLSAWVATWLALSLVLIVPTLLLINSREVGWIFVGYALIHNISVLGLASMENISIPEIFGARNRYTLTAVVREIAAIIATGIGPVVAAAWVAAVTGSIIPIMVLMGIFTASALVAALVAPEWTGRDLRDPRPAM